jgi:hypothetical protein
MSEGGRGQVAQRARPVEPQTQLLSELLPPMPADPAGRERARATFESMVRGRLTATFNTAWDRAMVQLRDSWQQYIRDECGGVLPEDVSLDPCLQLSADGRTVSIDRRESERARDAARSAFVDNTTRILVSIMPGRGQVGTIEPLQLGMGEEFVGFLAANLTTTVGIQIPQALIDAQEESRRTSQFGVPSFYIIRRSDQASAYIDIPEQQRVEFPAARLERDHLPVAFLAVGGRLYYGWPNWINTPISADIGDVGMVPRRIDRDRHV